jgi:hypothetical protein
MLEIDLILDVVRRSSEFRISALSILVYSLRYAIVPDSCIIVMKISPSSIRERIP